MRPGLASRLPGHLLSPVRLILRIPVNGTDRGLTFSLGRRSVRALAGFFRVVYRDCEAVLK